MEYSLLAKALILATESHDGQFDLAGKPYILHPLHVMSKMEREDDKIVAVLHDIVEDTDVSLEDIEGLGFPGHILRAIDALTRREDESYSVYMSRVASNEIATRVKIADIRHNLDFTRIPRDLSEKDLERIKKHATAYRLLKAVQWNKENASSLISPDSQKAAVPTAA